MSRRTSPPAGSSARSRPRSSSQLASGSSRRAVASRPTRSPSSPPSDAPGARARMRLSAAAAVLLAVAAVAGGCGSSPDRAAGAVDTELCPFPLVVTVTSKTSKEVGTSALRFDFDGPSRIVLRNATTGRSAELAASGSHSVDTRTGSIDFNGHQVWYWAGGDRVPFMTTDGTGRLAAPTFVLDPGTSRARVVDPCARVAPAKPSTRPRTTRAPWGLPAYALSRVEYAGLTPLLGRLVRHDHVHLDIVVNGRKVTVPAGVGLAQPVDGC